MKFMKRIMVFLSILVFTVLLCVGLPTRAEADASGMLGENISWELRDGVLYIDGSGPMVAQSSGNPWWNMRSSIKGVEVGEGITAISKSAFAYLDKMVYVLLPGSLERIDTGAFQSSARNKVLMIFRGNAPQIHDTAFYNANIRACYPAENPTWTEEVRKGYSGGVTWCTAQDSYAAEGTWQYNLKWTLTWDGCMTVSGEGAMMMASSKDATSWAYYRDYIRALVVEEGVTSVGMHAFDDCKNLETISLPESVVTIGGHAFKDCKKLTTVELPRKLQTIGENAFENCESIESVRLPDTVTTMGQYAYSGCTGMKELTLSPNLKTIPYMGFYYCEKLTEVIIPEGCKNIELGGFSRCFSLERVMLPYSLETLGIGVFEECSKIKRLILQENLRSFDTHALGYMDGLEQVFFVGDAPEMVFEDKMLDKLFGESPKGITVYCLPGAAGWGKGRWQGAKIEDWTYSVTGPACGESGVQRISAPEYGIEFERTLSPVMHYYLDWIVEEPATMDKEGLLGSTCCYCGNVRHKTIPMIPYVPQVPMVSNNRDWYEYGICETPIHSYLTEMPDGTFLRVEASDPTFPEVGDNITVEYYDRDYRFIRRQMITREMPLFGGYYFDGEYHYMVFAKNRFGRDYTTEMIVVKYSQDWRRLDDTARIQGPNSVVMFSAGTLRMTHSGGILHIRTCHEMGNGHQANLSLRIYTPDMVLLSMSQDTTQDNKTGFVSHSFNQFVAEDEGDFLAVDHGDAYPRSVVLFRCRDSADTIKMKGTLEQLDLLPIYGEIGENATGVTVGGLEVSEKAYLVAGSSIPQDGTVDFDGMKNVFLSVTPKEDFSQEGTKLIWLTNYAQGGSKSARMPYLVELDKNSYGILWMEGQKLRYTFVDGMGKGDGTIYTADAPLSECTPICKDGKIIWYVTEGIVTGSVPYFCELDPRQPETVQVHRFTVTGDMDADGVVMDADAVYLLRYTLFPESYWLNGDGDINCDGQVTDADAVYLLRHTLFPNEYPLYPGKQ